MSAAEMLLKKIEGLSPDYMAQVYAFIDQLTHAAPSVEDAFKENGACTPETSDHEVRCPLNAENPPFNAVTLAAMKEGDAMMRGEIPVKWHRPKGRSREDILESIREAMDD